MAKTCDTCGCWHQLREYNGVVYGECRAHSPVVCSDFEVTNAAFWPETASTDWCGDHTGLRHCELPGPERGA